MKQRGDQGSIQCAEAAMRCLGTFILGFAMQSEYPYSLSNQ